MGGNSCRINRQDCRKGLYIEIQKEILFGWNLIDKPFLFKFKKVNII
jgi:hypothetical protein